MKTRIYVEGGGNTQRLKGNCRRGFKEFFRKAGFEGKLPQVIASGSRSEAYKDFCIAWQQLREKRSSDTVLLLVDSEGPVAENDGPWEHLRKNPEDQWQAPSGATDEVCHLMVQCMEAWFLADRNALKGYFGQGFNEGALPKRPEVEKIAKEDVLKGLKEATRHVKTRGRYDKGDHSFEILAVIDPHRVRAVAPYCDRLLDTLDDLT